jgi:hypothetical protein
MALPGFFGKHGKNTYRSSYGNYMKIGIYKWAWSQGKPSGTDRRVMYFDELHIASGDQQSPSHSPGKLSLMGRLTFSPVTPTSGQKVEASYTVVNTGGQAMSVPWLLVGARDPGNANVDFPGVPNVVLQPGQQYTYRQSRTFSVAGNYSAWPAAYLDGDWLELTSAHTSLTVQSPAPGKLSLVGPLDLSPSEVACGQAMQATYTVTNTGGQPLTVPWLLVGARDPANANVDFPGVSNVTLQPGQQYTYRQSRAFAVAGGYTAWPAAYLDGDWRELAPEHSRFIVH